MLLRNMALLRPFGRKPRGGLGRGWFLGPYRESPCRAWLGTTPGFLPLATGQGGGWEGLAVGVLPGRPLPSMARHYARPPPFGRRPRGGLGGVGCWGFTGKASAEHGSALQAAPLPFTGEGLGGFGALPGGPLPSMARHYGPPLSRLRERGWGEGGFWALPVSPCRAWLGTTGGIFAAMLRRRMRWAKCSCFTWIDLNFRQCDAGEAEGAAQGAPLSAATH